MFPAEYETVVYFRRFPKNYDYASITSLFSDDHHHFGYFPSPLSERLEWQVRQEFASVAYGEPLECVHARRAAFGGEEIYIDADRVTPDRCLLFPDRSRAMRSHGHVQVRWCVPDVMETPRFCISSAMSDQSRLKWGLGPHYIEMLQAATKLKPKTFDVFGFYVPTKKLFGAVEIVEHQEGDLFDSHVFCISSDTDLDVGDELWSWYVGSIGETRIVVKRLVAVVTDITGRAVPKLERPDFR